MKVTTRILGLATAGMLLGASIIPALALEVNVGGIGVSANTGGSNGSVATVGVNTGATGNQAANVVIGTGAGDLVGVDQDGNTTNGSVNLGLDSLLGDLDLGGVIPGGVTPGGSGPADPTVIAGAYAGLTATDQQALQIKCRSVLAKPSFYDAGTLQLCRLLVRMN